MEDSLSKSQYEAGGLLAHYKDKSSIQQSQEQDRLLQGGDMFYGATPVLPVEQATSFRLSDNAQNPAIGLTITSPTLALSDSATQAAIFHGSNQSREMRTAERQNRLQMENQQNLHYIQANVHLKTAYEARQSRLDDAYAYMTKFFDEVDVYIMHPELSMDQLLSMSMISSGNGLFDSVAADALTEIREIMFDADGRFKGIGRSVDVLPEIEKIKHDFQSNLNYYKDYIHRETLYNVIKSSQEQVFDGSTSVFNHDEFVKRRAAIYLIKIY